MGENEVAMEWFLKALALNPSDSGVLKKLGELADIEGDRQQAYQHYYDVSIILYIHLHKILIWVIF